MSKTPLGAVLLNKPEGITSFQALSLLKKNLGTKKIGHTGTLDKFASGLLVVLVGSLTKMNNYITALDKVYEATFKFGKTTKTLDTEQPEEGDGIIPTFSNIEKIIPTFLGEISQVPPDFSAVHIDGKRAYERVLQGESIELKARLINIFSFDLLSYDESLGELQVKIHCSKGTYIRSIARDLALSLGTLGYVKKLKRTKVGDFSLENSLTADNVNQDSLMGAASFFDLLNIPKVKVEDIKWFQEGKNPLTVLKSFNSFSEGKIAIFSQQGDFIALIEKVKDSFSYIFVAPF